MSVLVVVVVVLLLALPLVLAQELEEDQGEQLCVLPIGDSITQGVGDHDSWRPELWQLLLDARTDTDVQFTGSQLDSRNHLEHAGHRFPQHHEGHSGWTSTQILDGLYEGHCPISGKSY